MGVDIGSTTIKIAVIDDNKDIVFTSYHRHNANIRQAAKEIACELYGKLGNCKLKSVITGSVGMGYAKKVRFGFVQEVISAAEYVSEKYPEVKTFIDMGGEDSKMIFFEKGKVPDIRMNGSCAGGTGAFIDQTATLLGIPVTELNELASKAVTIYPIASRCGVFSKTDIQNLISRNVSRADIAASVFNAVALQVISSLAHGMDILPRVFFCGGPFAFMPELKKSFVKVLNLKEEDAILPDNPQFIPALGCAYLAEKNGAEERSLLEIIYDIRFGKDKSKISVSDRLPGLFSSKEEYDTWLAKKMVNVVPDAPVQNNETIECFLGVDSGSTTTKIVLIDKKGQLVYRDYRKNNGDSFSAFVAGLNKLKKEFADNHDLKIIGTAVTGYGENLLKTAFNMDFGIVETIAHFVAARRVSPDVSFVLDIGGQDMKAIFVEHGSIKRIEINEACSSGCGSFIETYAASLNYPVEKFASMAEFAKYPYDLGTRCTVFMNSKVKQAMREGSSIDDIAAGFSYSVIKNCLFKVLKLKSVEELGNNIVVQGGTFKNHSIVRALEVETGCDVKFSNIPELMGAYGAALYAMDNASSAKKITIDDLINAREYKSSFEICPGCENHCNVKVFEFGNGNKFFSGNNCEKIYSNKSGAKKNGVNMFAEKYSMLFKRKNISPEKAKLRIGIPRALGIYENYPFWHALFNECGILPVLSGASTNKLYNSGARTIMADNICFPAKLMHGHINDLAGKKVDRIFYPYVVYEYKEDEKSKNSFNCPIVAGYSDVIKSSMSILTEKNIPFDAPVITFNDKELLYKSCSAYLKTLGIKSNKIKYAIQKAVSAQKEYMKSLTERSVSVYEKARKENRTIILLAGRPYHIDPLIEHKISHSISEMGIDVVTENVSVKEGAGVYEDLQAVSQWAYPNRIFKAAHFVADSDADIHLVELNSFGCGPDSFNLDEIKNILDRSHKNLTVLKIDDVNNTGSLRLRIRSLVESIRFAKNNKEKKALQTTAIFGMKDRGRTIIAPYFAEGYSEFIPSIMKLLGYNVVNLPMGCKADVETGLKYANNEICYPATIVVGSILNAIKSGKYDLNNLAVAITQTGGQCRATNYMSMIKNAIVTAGYSNIPVISLAIGDGVSNTQPGFVIDWKKIAKITVYTMLYADCLNKLYFSSAVREKEKGTALKLRNKYMNESFSLIESKNYNGILALLEKAVEDFDKAIYYNDNIPIIGIVGEIYVKYNSFSNNNVIDWLTKHGVEVVSPSLYNFFTMAFGNSHVNKKEFIKKEPLPVFVMDLFYKFISYYVHKFDKICSSFKYYHPFTNVLEDVKKAAKIINPAADFGEGWLIPAEITNLAERGVKNVVSLQPFGCIANHIISKGIERKVKRLFPDMSILSLDFDSGTSKANQFNRLYFMVDNCRKSIDIPAMASSEAE